MKIAFYMHNTKFLELITIFYIMAIRENCFTYKINVKREYGRD